MNSVPLPFQRFALGLMLLILWSCNGKEALITEAKAYQESIDAKITVVTQKQDEIKQSIIDNAAINQDTFTLAKSLVPLKAAKFKLEAKYDEFTVAVANIQENKIDKDSLKKLVKQSEIYITNLFEETNFND